MGAEKLLLAARIRTFASTVLERIGMGSGDAAVVADALAWADLRGISAQGLTKLPVIVARVRAGGTASRPPVRIVSETAAVTVYDAASEWGQVSGVRAMRAAVRKAADTGVGMSRPLSELNQPQGVSQFFLAIDPRVVMPLAEFTSRVDALVEVIHRSPPAPGVDRVRAPGERAAALAARREHDGVPFAEPELVKLRALGAEYGVDLGI